MEKLLDEKFPPGLDYEYEASLSSHDPLDEDDVPECPPAAVEIEDEDDAISGVTSGFDVSASIACDAASVLPQEHVQEMFQDVFNQGGQSSVLSAAATSSETDAQAAKKPKSNLNKISYLVVVFFSNLPATKT